MGRVCRSANRGGGIMGGGKYDRNMHLIVWAHDDGHDHVKENEEYDEEEAAQRAP